MSMSKPERLSHYGILVIALTAVVVSVWQGRISQKQLEIAIEHNKRTVRPYIEITKIIDGSDNLLEIEVSNQGYGPARIHKFELLHDGQVFDAWNPVLEAAGLNEGIRQLYNYNEGSVVAPGAPRIILRLKTPNTTKNLGINIVYESIYQQLDSTRMDF